MYKDHEPMPDVTHTAGKEMLAVEAFARALRALPGIIADNAGYDSTDLVSQLRAAHASGKSSFGLDMENGTIGDVGSFPTWSTNFSGLFSRAVNACSVWPPLHIPSSLTVAFLSTMGRDLDEGAEDH